ncbi:MAG: AAA family ATPase [Leptolyngbyaceae cyanobacterium MO_188.B28]|nr:AAA family ATPase [Leptolyngbyaceae cyanobacterium MO_188.B28]
MDLFDQHRQALIAQEAPLAARMRPRTLDEFVGQDAVVGPGRLLRRAIQADQLSSLIFYGPPGTGKTTLARIIANTTRAHFISINAVLAGVKDIRAAIATAQDKRGQFSQRTILFIDEVHRFNKAQQDALLPWVENGTVILIGATTENPYFEVNKALVSRSRIFQLKLLNPDDLRQVAAQALSDSERGFGAKTVQIDSEALDHLVNVANGDARALLNALELAVETTPIDQTGAIHITLPVAEESIQRRAVLYDKEGDAHFDTISAFIKSVRGSDPDAALYWLARMIYAGEDPRYIFRRLVILASEDIGLADPNAVVVVTGCAAAFDRVGVPEGRYPLAQAVLYLATAPKSNSAMGFFEALSAVEKEQQSDVPNPLRDGNRDKEGFGHGKGYLYPHSYREHWVAQQYLPAGLQGQVFYEPSDQGYEDTIRVQVARRREAQLAAMVDGDSATPEILTSSPDDPARDRWLQRTLSQSGEQLAAVRDRLFIMISPQRHHVILDLNASSGLLTWEALRQAPEGGVYACVRTTQDRLALAEQAANLPELSRPIILQTNLADLSPPLTQAPTVKFDGIVGRNALLHEVDKAAVIQAVVERLRVGGAIALAESVPRQAQRLYALLDNQKLDATLYERLVSAEESIYNNADDPMVNWDVTDLQHWFEQHGLVTSLELIQTQTEIHITPGLLSRWFNPTRAGAEKLSYGDRLAQSFSKTEVAAIRQAFNRQLQNQTVNWQSTVAFITGMNSIQSKEDR